MNTTEAELMQQLIEEVREMREEQKSFKETQMGLSRRFLLILQRFETEIDLLKARIDLFVGFLADFETLIHRIKTAFFASRIWEQYEEYTRNDGKKRGYPKKTTGFDVERKPRPSAE
ncbi:MAG: hypothetical protein V3T23_10080 [Nitrososphaerales archaeon]